MCLLASAVLLTFSMPPYTLWPLAFVALVPLIAGARGLGFQWGCRFGFVWGFLVAAATTPWFWSIFRGSSAALWTLLGGFWGLSLGLVRQVFAQREAAARPVLSALVAATCWTGVEYFRAEVWPLKFALCSLGSTQVVGPFLPLMAFVGLTGVTLLVAAVNVLLALALERRDARPAAVAAALAALALAARFVPVTLTEGPGHAPGGPAVKVALLQAEGAVVPEMATMSRQPAAKDVDLLVWPEYCVFDFPLEVPALQQAFDEVAREHHATFLYGGKQHADHHWYDTIFALDSAAKPLGWFHKAQPIPLFDDGLPGKEFAPIATPQGPLGVMVCYDSDFSWISRRITDAGAELLVVPTLDAASWGSTQHQQRVPLCQARAVENGRWLVRAASSGVSAIIAPDGTVTARLDAGVGLLPGTVRRLTGRTPFTRGGWLLAPLSLAFTLIAGLVLGLRRPRPPIAG